MTLTPGTRLGPYEIVAPLGSGGMGEVYRAADTKLGRLVALKVLPALLSSDPQRLARFEREAQFLAALNHPNIAGIYGLEDSREISALVMELVEGPTLSERIARSPIEIHEVLFLARQFADALEYAHERGIIHRDLKPANLKIRPDDTLKVLDFGLAKALNDEVAVTNIHDSPTLTLAATGAGVVLGTVAYMAPEQARGKPVDRRADIWSFGCVLFEMLSGRLAFEGETVTDTLSEILTKEPDWSRLPSTTPARIRELLRRCLQKDARKRLQSIGDARIEIEECIATEGSNHSIDLDDTNGGSSGLPPQRVRKPLLTAFCAAAAVALVGSMGWWLKGTRTRTYNWTGTAVPGSSIAFGPRISPDGHMLAFQAMVGNLTQVAVVNLDSGTWALLTRDENRGFVNEISWAPDGSKLYFDRVVAVPKGIYSVPAMGGAERLVLEDAGTPEVLPDGSLIVAKNDTASRLRIYHYWPDSQRLDPLPGWVTLGTTIPLRVFPDGKELAFFGGIKSAESADYLYAMDIGTGNCRRLAPDLKVAPLGEGFPIAPTPEGRSVVIDMHSGDLHRLVAIPRDGGRSSNDVVTLTRAPWYLDFSKDGTLYLDEIDRPHEVLQLSEQGGTPEVLASSDYLRVPDLSYMDPIQITDGRTLLDTRFFGRGQVLVGTSGGNFVPLLETREETTAPATSLPMDEVAFVLGSGDAQTIAIASADQGRLLRRLQGTKGKNIASLAASPDGHTLYYSSSGTVWAIPTTDGTPRQIARGDNVAVDPGGRDLVIRRNEGTDSRLFRVSLSGARTQEIPVPGDWSLAPVAIGQSAVAKNGKILIPVSPRDSWFYRLAILDTASGRVTGIPITYRGDTINGDWADDGRILAVGLPLKGHIWRFTKVEVKTP